MAHKKAQGSVQNGRDSRAQRLGVKLFGGQVAQVGSIIIRQRGTTFRPGINTALGKDDTIYATKPGIVQFNLKKIKKYTGRLEEAKVVNVIDEEKK